MKPDIYTKVVLTVIAMMLALIACNQYLMPTTAQAQGPFAGMQFSFNGTSFTVFDTRTGDIWCYSYTDGWGPLKEYAGYHVNHMGKLRRVGEIPAGAPRAIQLGAKDAAK